MKKTILTIACVAILSLYAFSQAQFALGLKGGLNFAKFDATDVSGSLKNKTGFNGGAFALIKLTKIGIQPEILFSQQGSKFEFDGNNIDNNFDYINIPVILKLYTVAGINIQAGPQFGFLTRAEIDGSNVKDSFKGSDLSLALGLGWDLPFGLTFDARYNLGLTKIDESDPGFDAVRNQVIQLSVGFKMFKFGK